jgi:flagellar biosynthesis/type III secretory pathway protein FliH
MKLGFGRVVAARADDERTTADRPVARPRATARVVPEVVVAASERARQIVARAEAEAAARLSRAETRAAELATELATRAKTEAATALAARELALGAREANARERQLDDTVALARLLAERLLGEALRVEPARVVALARQALAEARGARQVTLAAHPEDVPLLERALASGELTPPVLVVADPKRPRGSLRLDTELGTLDAELAPQLDRLAEKLREALRHA